MQTIAGYNQTSVDARGLRFNVLEWGAVGAPPFVLLHGLTGHAHIWDHMAPDLARRYHVYAIDQRGHGDTSHAEAYATEQFVEDLEALRQHWSIDRFALMGLSMGGHNAMAYTTKYPQRVSHLVVIDIPPSLDRTKWPNWDELVRLAEQGHAPFASFDEAVEGVRSGNPTAPEENLRYRTQNNLHRLPDGRLLLKWDPKVQVRWEPADLWSALPKIASPALLVRGGRTYVLPADTAARMVAAFPDADFAEIADSGHSVPTDRPEKLAPIVLDWLKRRGY